VVRLCFGPHALRVVPAIFAFPHPLVPPTPPGKGVRAPARRTRSRGRASMTCRHHVDVLVTAGSDLARVGASEFTRSQMTGYSVARTTFAAAALLAASLTATMAADLGTQPAAGGAEGTRVAVPLPKARPAY